ncbi:MAG TPA: polymorphic toxin-type HINT domain-containing protein [Fimbriiglobus sp.]|jgi:hypothetical protein
MFVPGIDLFDALGIEPVFPDEHDWDPGFAKGIPGGPDCDPGIVFNPGPYVPEHDGRLDNWLGQQFGISAPPPPAILADPGMGGTSMRERWENQRRGPHILGTWYGPTQMVPPPTSPPTSPPAATGLRAVTDGGEVAPQGGPVQPTDDRSYGQMFYDWGKRQVGKVRNGIREFKRDPLKAASDGFAGAADALTLGGTARLRRAGGFDAVDYNSGAYGTGEIAGTALGVALPGSACKLGKAAAEAAAAGARAAAITAKGAAYGLRGLQGAQAAAGIANGIDALNHHDYWGAAFSFAGTGASFAGLRGACFAAGTPLLDSWTTSKPIEEFQIGDLVLSRDEFDVEGKPELKLVEEVFRLSGTIWHVHAGGQVIRTTGEHPFWVRGRGWRTTSQLKIGDHLHGHDGQWVAVTDLLDTGEEEVVYNLRIAEYHTYFVGADEWGFSVWAHNACDPRILAFARATYTRLAGIMHDHHITPKYLGGSASGPTMRIDAAYHQLITNAFRAAWAYGGRKPTPGQLQQIMQGVYGAIPI